VTTTSDRLDERVARLERQNRRLRALVAGITVLVAASLVLHARPRRPAAVAEAEKFVVRDREGRTRAVLGLDYATAPRHSPVRLALYNDAEHASAVLYLSEAFAGLVIKTGVEEREWSTTLFANPKDGAGFQIGAGRGKSAVRMTADAAAAVRFLMQDAGGAIVFRAP